MTDCRVRCPSPSEVAEAEGGYGEGRNITTIVTGRQISERHFNKFMLIDNIFPRRTLHPLGMEGGAERSVAISEGPGQGGTSGCESRYCGHVHISLTGKGREAAYISLEYISIQAHIPERQVYQPSTLYNLDLLQLH